MRKQIRKDINLVVCPLNQQHTDIIVCAASCNERRFCKEYRKKITNEMLLEFIANHPKYKLVGELMPTGKTAKSIEKTFWVVSKDNQIEEVTEKELMTNPEKYLKKEIWQKPPYHYELVVSLKRIKD
ncbi:MAG: hypothetical protein K9N07_07040 [Candidatus Cloacimonetes bacterium]|nr:hypothetical protein [Candidatus Cloacimonadota bacterium]